MGSRRYSYGSKTKQIYEAVTAGSVPQPQPARRDAPAFVRHMSARLARLGPGGDAEYRERIAAALAGGRPFLTQMKDLGLRVLIQDPPPDIAPMEHTFPEEVLKASTEFTTGPFGKMAWATTAEIDRVLDLSEQGADLGDELLTLLISAHADAIEDSLSAYQTADQQADIRADQCLDWARLFGDPYVLLEPSGGGVPADRPGIRVFGLLTVVPECKA